MSIATMSAPTVAPRAAPTVDVRLIASLAAVYVIWSSTYLAMRVAVAELPPFFMAGIRYVSAGGALLVAAKVRGAAMPTRTQWRRALPVGAFLFLGGNGFVALAERTVSSGGAAVVCAMMPLWVGVLGAFTGSRPSRREWLSLVTGFVGVIVLMGGPSLAGEPAHIGFILAAPICWAIGSVLARRNPAPKGTDSLVAPGAQMIAGGAALLVAALLHGESIPMHASANAWLALGYLWLFGSIVAFTAYAWLLRNARPVVATSYAYVNPILAVLFGAALSGEPLGVTTVIANVLIVGAVVVALRKPRAPDARR